MAIEQIPIRARIVVRNFCIETPYILNFNVNKQRGTFSTFSASIKIKGEDVSLLTDKIEIYVGRKENYLTKKIFTGYIKKMKPSPCWDDPSYIILNIEGADILSKLASKKFNRRQTISDTSWTLITGVTPGLRSGKLKFTKDPVLVATGGDVNSSDGSTATGNDDTSAINNNKVLGDVKKSATKVPPTYIIEITRE